VLHDYALYKSTFTLLTLLYRACQNIKSVQYDNRNCMEPLSQMTHRLTILTTIRDKNKTKRNQPKLAGCALIYYHMRISTGPITISSLSWPTIKAFTS